MEKVNIQHTENAELFMNEDIIKSIDRLLSESIGDHGRLEHIKNSLIQGKSLYNSDKKYLNSLLDNNMKSTINEQPKNNSNHETPINLDKLRKSQLKQKYKVKPTKFAISYSNSQRGSAKIHKASCHNVYRSSQEGDIKWTYYNNYPDAKHAAEMIGQNQPYGWKYAGCCMRKFPLDIIMGSFITCLFLGILGGLIAWYFTRDYFGKWARIWLGLGGFQSIIFLSSILFAR